MWKKRLLWVLGTSVISWVFRLPYRLIEDALYDWINTYIAQRWQVIVSYLTEWGFPVVLAGITAWLLIRLGMYLGQTKQNNESRKILDEKEKTSPKISVKPKIVNDRFILEVYNSGIEAQFTAKGRVIDADVDSELYTMYWEANKENTCHIDANGTESILVSGVSPKDEESQNLHKNGLMLYKMGTSLEQVFGARTLGKVGNLASFLEPRDTPLKKPEYKYFDRCIVEVKITSSPPLLEPFEKSYSIEVEHKEYWHRLLFTLSTTDKKGSQT